MSLLSGFLLTDLKLDLAAFLVATVIGPGIAQLSASGALEFLAATTHTASNSSDHASPAWTVLCVVLVILLLGLMFVLRKVLSFVLNVLFIIVCAGLVILAIFGHQLGIFAAIADLVG